MCYFNTITKTIFLVNEHKNRPTDFNSNNKPGAISVNAERNTFMAEIRVKISNI